MSLEDIYVHDDWEQRSRLWQRIEGQRWKMALVVVGLSLVMAILVKNMPIRGDVRMFLTDGVAYSLYLTAGAWAIAYPARGRKLLLYTTYAVLVAGLPFGTLAAQHAASSQGADRLVCFVISGSMLAIPGCGIVSYAILKYRGRAVSRGLDPMRLASAVLFGLLGGMFITLHLFLSFHFSGLHSLEYRPLALFFQDVAFTLGVRAAGEEVLFRGVVFRYLRTRAGKGFWGSTFITLALNIAIYVVAMPATDSPVTLTLLLMGPSIMIITNSALYAWQGTLISPFVSNATYQVASLALGLR
jgi:hypothetical protein